MERRGLSDEERRRRCEQGVLFGSGLVGGEGVLGVVVAGIVFWQSLRGEPGQSSRLPLEIGEQWLEGAARTVGLPAAAAESVPQLAAFLLLIAFAAFYTRCCRVRSATGQE
jgi:hypothetical protein